MDGVWKRACRPHFLLKLFVPRSKRFRHIAGKTKNKTTKYKRQQKYKISQNNGKKHFNLCEDKFLKKIYNFLN